MSSRALSVALALLAAACQFPFEPRFDESVDPQTLQSVELAAATDALTFARFVSPDGLHTLRVSEVADGMLRGIDLTVALDRPDADPIELFLEFGYETVLEAGASAQAVAVSAADTVIPVRLRAHHIAAGTNFPEHADEAGVEEGPFLFPKLVEPTPSRAPVPVDKALLDYEVELAWVPLQPLMQGDAPQFMGLLLCNDYTDRSTLLRHVDPSNVASGRGFTTGKSFDHYLPVGDLFVIPRDHRRFAANLELNLYVNYRLRQRERVERAVWDIDALLRETWARRELTWEHRGDQVSLFPAGSDVIEDRVLIMSGTPAGTIFNDLNAEQKASGFASFLFFGWGDSIPTHAIEDYITDAQAAGVYLFPGDKVDIHVQRMGVIRNEIVP